MTKSEQDVETLRAVMAGALVESREVEAALLRVVLDMYDVLVRIVASETPAKPA